MDTHLVVSCEDPACLQPLISRSPSSQQATPFAKPSSRLYVRHRRASAHLNSTVISQPPTQQISQHKPLPSLPISLPFPPIKRPTAGRLLPCPVSPGPASPARIAKQDQAGSAGPAAARLHGTRPPPAWRRRRNAKGLGSTKNRTFFLSLIIITKIPYKILYPRPPYFDLSWVIPRRVARGRTSRVARWSFPHTTREAGDVCAWRGYLVLCLSEEV